jgi:hypothetical protein
MFFEVLGFLSGVAAIGTAWMLLLRHDRLRVMSSLTAARASRGQGGNALIWPSR